MRKSRTLWSARDRQLTPIVDLQLAIHRTSRHELFAVFQRFSAFLKNQKMADVLRNEELTEMLNAGFHRLLELDTEENAAESQQTDTVRAVASLILAEGEICKESGPALVRPLSS